MTPWCVPPHAMPLQYEPQDSDDKLVLQTLVGDHENPYPFIPFPAIIPPRPPAEKRHTMVVVLTGFAEWDRFTKPLLQYLATCPDAIDVVVMSRADQVGPPAAGNVCWSCFVPFVSLSGC